MSTEAEFLAEMAHLDWRMNPCGRGSLKKALLQRLEERAGIPASKGVSFGDKESFVANEDIVWDVLERAVQADPKFPGEVYAYWEGPLAGEYLVEIYARGEPMAVLPEPPKPERLK